MAMWEGSAPKSMFLLMFVVEEEVLFYGKMSMAFFKTFNYLLEKSTLYCMWWWLYHRVLANALGFTIS